MAKITIKRVWKKLCHYVRSCIISWMQPSEREQQRLSDLAFYRNLYVAWDYNYTRMTAILNAWEEVGDIHALFKGEVDVQYDKRMGVAYIVDAEDDIFYYQGQVYQFFIDKADVEQVLGRYRYYHARRASIASILFQNDWT